MLSWIKGLGGGDRRTDEGIVVEDDVMQQTEDTVTTSGEKYVDRMASHPFLEVVNTCGESNCMRS